MTRSKTFNLLDFLFRFIFAMPITTLIQLYFLQGLCYIAFDLAILKNEKMDPIKLTIFYLPLV